jgi:hypothetical protein
MTCMVMCEVIGRFSELVMADHFRFGELNVATRAESGEHDPKDRG